MALNLTPLIDVVFLLLIFFMVATTFLEPEREISIELPEAATASERAEVPDEIVINVLRDGSLNVNGSAVDRAACWLIGGTTTETRWLGGLPEKNPTSLYEWVRFGRG